MWKCFPLNNMENLQKSKKCRFSIEKHGKLMKTEQMQNSHRITWQIDEKLKKCKILIEYHGKLLLRPQICPGTYGNSPQCPTGHRPFGAAAQKVKKR